MTLERYFKIAHQKGIIDFSLRADVYTGIVSFYIHPDSKDGDTRDYYVFGNELIPKEEFDKRKAECGEKLIQRFLEIKERKNNTMGVVECPSRPLEPLVSPQTHELKTWKVFFEPMWNNLKNFEIRWNDRDYKVGDRLRLMEYDNVERKYTGRFICKTIIYMTDFAQESGYVVMQLDERLSG
jgi:hypothetical protein